MHFLDLLDNIKTDMKEFVKNKRPLTGKPSISAKLELNHKNLIKIIDSGNQMETLFKTVSSEVGKIGDLSQLNDSWKQISTAVSSQDQRS